jgi:hypothetical protein
MCLYDLEERANGHACCQIDSDRGQTVHIGPAILRMNRQLEKERLKKIPYGRSYDFSPVPFVFQNREHITQNHAEKIKIQI